MCRRLGRPLRYQWGGAPVFIAPQSRLMLNCVTKHRASVSSMIVHGGNYRNKWYQSLGEAGYAEDHLEVRGSCSAGAWKRPIGARWSMAAIAWRSVVSDSSGRCLGPSDELQRAGMRQTWRSGRQSGWRRRRGDGGFGSRSDRRPDVGATE